MTRRSLTLLLLASACGRIDEIDLTRSASATVPGSPAAGPTVTLDGVAAIDLGGEAVLREEGIEPDDVDSAHLRSIHVQVTAGTSLERWLDAVTVRLSAPGLPEVAVARREGIGDLPEGTMEVDLQVDRDVDLKPYLTAPSTVLGVDGTGTAPPVDTTVLVTATVRVDVSVPGLLR